MQKPLIILAVTASVLVGAYLVYDLFRPKCGQIFEQTALNVGAKAEIIKTKGEVFIGREKIQELTSSSQKVGQHLKTCCIVLDGGKLNPDQFQRCIEGAQNYETQLTKVVASLDEAQAAKQQDSPNLVKAKVEQINSELDAAKSSSKELEKHVTEISKLSSQETRKSSDILPPTSKNEKLWEILPNPKLKSQGRIVVSLPIEADVLVEIFEAGGKTRFTFWSGSGASDFLPGQYDVKIYGATVASVPVQSGMDTRIRTGVLNIAEEYSYWELYDETKTTKMTFGNRSNKLGLLVGRYQVKVTGGFRDVVVIKDGQVTDF